MNKRHMFYVGMVLLAALVLFGAPMVASAYHATTDVPVRDANGVQITTDRTIPYSPKQTCGGCHFDCATGLYSSNPASYCQTDATKKNCTIAGNCPDYESLETKTISKHKGFPTSTGVAFATFDVKAPMHGASTGKHSTHGRNEGLAAAQRTIWGAPAFISSPGMFGRY